MTTTLHDMTNTQLVGVHNALALSADRPTLKTWKGSKQAILDKIAVLQSSVAPQTEDAPFDAVVDAIASMEDGEFDAAMANCDEPGYVPDVSAGNAEDMLSDDDLDEDGEPMETREVSDDAVAASGRTIRAAAIDLLCKVVYHENRDEKSNPEKNVVAADHPRARTVGMAYDDIILAIQEEFNGCKTTVACLRWYSVKIRVEEHGYEGLRLPQRRPRAKPRTAA